METSQDSGSSFWELKPKRIWMFAEPVYFRQFSAVITRGVSGQDWTGFVEIQEPIHILRFRKIENQNQIIMRIEPNHQTGLVLIDFRFEPLALTN